MLVFRKGTWYSVELPFSDPMLTGGHKAAAAAVCVNERIKGTSFEVAVATAEKAMYGEILGGLRIPREEHNAPQNEEK